MALDDLKKYKPLTHVDYESEVFSETENVQIASSLTDKQDSASDWQPVATPDLSVFQGFETPFQAIKTAIEFVYQPVEALLSVMETITGFLGKAADPVRTVLEEIRDQINGYVDQLGGTGGVHVYYKSPVDIRTLRESVSATKQRTEEEEKEQGFLENPVYQTVQNNSRKLDEFFKQFSDSFKDKDRRESELWIPKFGPDEYVVGYCVLLLLPGYKEAVETLQSILQLFNIPFIQKADIDANERNLARFDARLYFKPVKSFSSEEKYKGVWLKWTRFRFPHKIIIKPVYYEDLKTGETVYVTETDVEIVNDGAEWTKDTHDYEIANFGYGRFYRISVELWVQNSVYDKLLERSLEISELAGYGIARQSYEGESYSKQLAREDVNIRSPFKTQGDDWKGKFYGDGSDGEWFGASINSMLPQIAKIKQNMKVFIDNLFDQMVEKVTAVERISGAITKKIDGIVKQVEDITNQIYAILDKSVLDLTGGAIYTKYVPPKLGGTDQFIKDVTNVKGLDQQWLRDSNYVAAFMVMGGGKDAFQVETIIDLIRLFLPQDDGEPDTATVQLEQDPFTEALEAIQEFDLTGIDSPFRPTLKQPFGG